MSGKPVQRWQARPNVIFEAGMAYFRAPLGLAVVILGHAQLFTDLDGMLVFYPTNKHGSEDDRTILHDTLRDGMKLAVNTSNDWMEHGDFDAVIKALPEVSPRSPFEPAPAAPMSAAALKIMTNFVIASERFGYDAILDWYKDDHPEGGSAVELETLGLIERTGGGTLLRLTALGIDWLKSHRLAKHRNSAPPTEPKNLGKKAPTEEYQEAIPAKLLEPSGPLTDGARSIMVEFVEFSETHGLPALAVRWFPGHVQTGEGASVQQLETFHLVERKAGVDEIRVTPAGLTWVRLYRRAEEARKLGATDRQKEDIALSTEGLSSAAMALLDQIAQEAEHESFPPFQQREWDRFRSTNDARATQELAERGFVHRFPSGTIRFTKEGRDWAMDTRLVALTEARPGDPNTFAVPGGLPMSWNARSVMRLLIPEFEKARFPLAKDWYIESLKHETTTKYELQALGLLDVLSDGRCRLTDKGRDTIMLNRDPNSSVAQTAVPAPKAALLSAVSLSAGALNVLNQITQESRALGYPPSNATQWDRFREENYVRPTRELAERGFVFRSANGIIYFTTPGRDWAMTNFPIAVVPSDKPYKNLK